MFTLKDVVLWGRSFDEYRRMFALSGDDLRLRILGCADGPASFNAELTAQGGHAVSCDPVYGCAVDAIEKRIEEGYRAVLEQTRQNAHEFVWNDAIPDVETLGRIRLEAMRRFVNDFEQGKASGRYIEAQLPQLPFDDGAFDLAVCSHFLFVYSGQFSEGFHVDSIRELCRVSRDVRVFPLLELGSVLSRHVSNVAAQLRCDGFRVDIEQVNYEFQRGGNHMMRVVR